MEIRWHSRKEPELKVHEHGEVVWLSWPKLDECRDFVHGFSTRLGGVSRGYLGSMNLSVSGSDDPKLIRENYRRLGEAAGFSPADTVISHQTHTANVRLMTEEDRGCGLFRERPYENVDGMITETPGIVLVTFYADCVPLYFVDPVHRAAGLSHSGWRGTVQKIGLETVRKMRECFGTRPEDLLCAIGPSICQDCYEVSRDVIDAVNASFGPDTGRGLYYRKENGRYQLDLWEANRAVLLEAGVRPEKISMPNLCTCCNPELLFSHRASGGKRGNLAAFLGIRR